MAAISWDEPLPRKPKPKHRRPWLAARVWRRLAGKSARSLVLAASVAAVAAAEVANWPGTFGALGLAVAAFPLAVAL